MKIGHIEIFEYTLPFVKPFVTSQTVMSERRGIIIRGVDENGLIGYGEIAPLPGFSRESLADCLEPAKAVTYKITKATIPDSPGNIAELVGALSDTPPTVTFGFELMLSDLAAQSAGQQLAHWLRPEACNSVATNAVLAGGEIESQVRNKLANNYGTFKLKIGAASLEEDIARVCQIRGLIGPDSRLRLDANRAYDYASAHRALSELHRFDLEYIEEPLRDPSANDLQKLRSSTNVPIAIDETLIEWCSVFAGNIAASQDQLAAFEIAVCKPALWGSISRTLRFAEQLQLHGKKVIVTSSIDTEIGVAAALQLACALRIEAACGLDTGGIFPQELVHSKLSPKGGRMSLPLSTGLGVSLDWFDSRSEMLRKIDVN